MPLVSDNNSGLPRVMKHEFGHSVQSFYFGPLYLLIIGIPSISRYSKIFLKVKKQAWQNYYKGYPENWANTLGEKHYKKLVIKKKYNMIFSNTEFYYTPPELISDSSLIIIENEAKHIIKVMRHSINDEIFVTDGKGNVYKSIINNVTKKEVIAGIKEKFVQTNKLKNVTFCIPVLKNQDRFEFALEKCVELGITNFLIFSAKKSYKRGVKIERWNKILIAAMKQSLLSHKPNINYSDSLFNDISRETNIFIFEQNSEETISNYFNNEKNINKLLNKKSFFIFGPEGGLTKEELNIEGSIKLQLTKNRLRAETAVIAVGSFINLL